MIVGDVTRENIASVQAFLERHADTALFLLSNLASLGHALGDDLNSGNFKCVYSNDEICGVFCLARRGNLLVETGGRTDCAGTILDACRAEPIPIRGVVAEWRIADAIWTILLGCSGFVEQYAARETLYGLEVHESSGAHEPGVRLLEPEDFAQWEPLNTAYLLEEGLPVQGTLDQRQAGFKSHALARRWWGYLDAGRLVATTALNAVHGTTGQVGGVYTIPERRRQGLSRATMQALIADSVHRHHLGRLILFTGEKNLAARRLYESLGFIDIGQFALLFGSAAPKPVR